MDGQTSTIGHGAAADATVGHVFETLAFHYIYNI